MFYINNNRYHGSRLFTKIIKKDTYRSDLENVIKNYDENFLLEKEYTMNEKKVSGFDFCIETILNAYEKEKFPQENILPLIIETSVQTMFSNNLTGWYETFEMDIVRIDDTTCVLSIATTEQTQADMRRRGQ